ncbi:hypothetical protein JCM3775_004128 [Rhodotorula graminis]
MATWAKRASAPTDTPSHDDSTPPLSCPADVAPATHPAPSSSVPRSAPISKANASDNWRANARPNTGPKNGDPPVRARAASKGNSHAPASAAAPAASASPAGQDDDEGAWETVEKKDKPAPVSRLGSKKSFAKDGNKKAGEGRKTAVVEEASSTAEGSAAPKGKAAAGRARAGSSSAGKGEKKAAAAAAGRPTLKPASWADDEENGILPSPNFGATSAPAAAAPSDAAVEVLVLPPSQAPSPTEEKEQKEVEQPAKKAPSAPAVNVWSVRKDQLAQASEPASSSPAPTPSAPSAPTPAADDAAPSSATETPAQDEGKKPAEQAQKKKEARPKEDKGKAAAAAVNGGGATATTSKSSPSTSRTTSAMGWSSTATPATSGPSKPLVVAGEDATSWPAPEDAVKQDEPKAKAGKEDKQAAQQQTGGKKKKGDKSKWIPIKADITVSAPAPGQLAKRTAKAAKAPGASTTGGAEKKGAQPAQQPGKGKAAAGAAPQPVKGAAAAQQGKGKKAAGAAGPNSRTAPLDTSVDAEGIIRPFGGATPAGPSSTTAKSASAEQTGSTSGPTTTPSASGGDSAQLPRQPPAFVPAHQQQFAGRGRGRGGAVRGRGGARGGANGAGFNRQFQQQHAVALAAGYVPVPVELDANGNPIVDQFGYPVAAQQLPQPTQGQQGQAGQAPFDPRMLDPTRYWLLGQLEWWFSIDNLCRDLFLRQSMDAAGWISVPLIASFNRIKNLTSDLSIVVETMRMTPVLEVSPKGRFVRLAQTWPEWLLPNAQKNDDVEKDFEEARAEVKALHERKERERESKGDKDAAPDAEGAAKPAVERDEAAVEPAAEKKDDAATDAPADADKADAASATTSATVAEPAPVAVEVNGEKDVQREEAKDAVAEPQDDATEEAKETAAAPAKKDAPSAPRKESLSPREAPRTISPKATPAQPILDTACASITSTTPSSTA